jgi:hypothetical protein
MSGLGGVAGWFLGRGWTRINADPDWMGLGFGISGLGGLWGLVLRFDMVSVWLDRLRLWVGRVVAGLGLPGVFGAWVVFVVARRERGQTALSAERLSTGIEAVFVGDRVVSPLGLDPGVGGAWVVFVVARRERGQTALSAERLLTRVGAAFVGDRVVSPLGLWVAPVVARRERLGLA